MSANTVTVYLWPDGSYCESDELEDFMNHGWSDDYEIVEIPLEDYIDTYMSQYIEKKQKGKEDGNND